MEQASEQRAQGRTEAADAGVPVDRGQLPGINPEDPGAEERPEGVAGNKGPGVDPGPGEHGHAVQTESESGGDGHHRVQTEQRGEGDENAGAEGKCGAVGRVLQMERP